jgi:micrococcal nuclease
MRCGSARIPSSLPSIQTRKTDPDAWRVANRQASPLRCTLRVGSMARRAPLLACLAVALTALPGWTAEPRVGRVLDGDSIVLTDGNQVRYLGINAPEAGEPFSEAARALNRRLVEGRRLRLVQDREDRDRYGRILAYVYRDGQGGERFVNAELLRAGLAHLLIFGPLREIRTLASAQEAARRARRGMWGPGGPPGPLKITAPRRRRPKQLRTITLCNIADRDIDLEGYAVVTDDGSFRLPSARLPVGHVVLVIIKTGASRTLGRGRNRVTGSFPRRIYWDIPRSPKLTSIALLAPSGTPIDRVRFTGTDR